MQGASNVNERGDMASVVLAVLIVIVFVLCETYMGPACYHFSDAFPVSLLTYPVIESNPLVVAGAAAVLFSLGRDLERAMGTWVYMRLLGTTVLVTVAAMVTILLVYNILVPSYLYCIFGPWPIMQAICVGQCRTRGLSAQVFGARLLASVRTKHLPAIVVLATLPVAFDIGDFTVILSALVSLYVSWAILSPGSPTSFSRSALLCLFPIKDLWQWMALQLSVQLSPSDADGVITPTLFMREGNGTGSATGLETAGAGVLLPGSTSEEADRRRAIALAALSQKIQQQQGNPQQQDDQKQESPADVARDV